ncbi:uncharacterized protein LOC101862372 [Aplysia californica]|uniref:Chloride channel CLIC-like protein 1 n=1 Tax=Aplysia californica TaxID=6500 RepID=A0ABM0K308_APLCA|nr:uncharacterized protein LOC101862372 [Aplysia californica]
MAALNSKQSTTSSVNRRKEAKAGVKRAVLIIILSTVLALSTYVCYKYASVMEDCNKLLTEVPETRQADSLFFQFWSWLFLWSGLEREEQLEDDIQTDRLLCQASFCEALISILTVNLTADISDLFTVSVTELGGILLLYRLSSFLTVSTVLNCLLVLAVSLILHLCFRILVTFSAKRQSVVNALDKEMFDLTLDVCKEDQFQYSSIRPTTSRFVGEVTPDCCSRLHRTKDQQSRPRVLMPGFFQWLSGMLIAAITVSIPWEFVRLYQAAVARREAELIQGTPPECSPESQTFFMSVKSLMRSYFSWTHGSDPCYDYHYALLVDPVWEVSPLMVLSTLLTRCLLLPTELISSSLGRSLRAFFTEIPAQWQLLVMLIAVVGVLILLLMLFRYRLSIPMLLRIEPRTPVRDTTSDGLAKSQYDSLTPKGRSFESDRNAKAKKLSQKRYREEISSEIGFTSFEDRDLQQESQYVPRYKSLLGVRDGNLINSNSLQNVNNFSKTYRKSHQHIESKNKNLAPAERYSVAEKPTYLKKNKEPRQKGQTRISSRDSLSTQNTKEQSLKKKKTCSRADSDWVPTRNDFHNCSDLE